MHPHAANYFLHGKPPALTGNPHPNLVPYAIFPTKTCNIFIGVGNDGTFRKLCEGDRQAGARRPIRALHATRTASPTATRCAQSLPRCSAEHEGEPLCDRLLAAGLPAGPVQKIDQALNSEHTKHRGDRHREGLVQGRRLADPLRPLPSRACAAAAEVQPARQEMLGEFGYLHRRDRRDGRQGRGLRRQSATCR